MKTLATPENMLAQRRARASGFSLIELMVVLMIILVLGAMAVPMIVSYAGTYRLSGAARGVAAQLALARLRAAASFTQAQLVINTSLAAYQVQICTTKNVSTGGCTTWTSDVPSTLAANCTPPAWTSTCNTQYLPSGITFGFPSKWAQPGTSGQTAYVQTSPVVFNSRGIPINSSFAPTPNDALYLTNSSGQYYAVTVYASGKVTLFFWLSTTSTWKEM